MLKGTTRRPDEVVGKIPPFLADCTVEKVAINAVMAGCKPEYMPVLLAAIEAALEPVFTLHGVLATTYFSSPIIIVNGPIAKKIGMNSGINALGQGNRANATIGRALNLIVLNVGGGRPGEADRSTLGAPSKYTLCFAEDESDPEWEPLSVARGLPRGVSAVTLFQGHGPEAFVDQKSRTPEGLTRSFALSLVKMGHRPAHAVGARAPGALAGALRDLQGGRLGPQAHRARAVRGDDPPGRGARRRQGRRRRGHTRESRAGEMVPKFHEDGLMVVRAGGPAGLFSAILPGWLAGRNRLELQLVTKEVKN